MPLRISKNLMQPAKRTSAPRKLTRKRKTATFLANSLALAAGIGTEFTFHFVGDLYIAEILLLLAAVPLLMLRGRRLLRRDLMPVYGFMALWLFGLIVADAYNQTTIVDRMRGVALITFFALDVATLCILLGRNDRRKILFLIGHTIGSLTFVKLQPTPAVADYPWKFGYAEGTELLVLLIASYLYNRRRYLVSGAFILGICAVNLLFNYRSPVLNLLITLVLVYPVIPERLGNLQILPASRTARTVVLIFLALSAAKTAGVLVNLVTQLGYVNEEAREKNQAQSQTGNLLLGGRPEFVIGLRAAMDSPIVGHGSWAKDPKYYEMLYDAMVESGAQEEQVGGDILADVSNPLIPAHSGIITAWIWAGILGLVFWIYIIWFVLRGLFTVAVSRPPFAPIYMWLIVSMFWDIFFSPFAASRRITDAFLLVVIADLMERRKAISSLAERPVRLLGNRRPFGRGTTISAVRS